MSLLLLSSESTPNPRTLFANGEQGLAIDVEEAYLRGWVYQDAAGATVAAAAGDPVGLILDTSKGGLDQLGSDLVSNGTFASDTVWTKGANWTIGSGVATKTGGAANDLTQTISSTAGRWYRITMDVTRTAGTLTVSLGTSGTTRAISATGSYTFYILAGSGTQTLTLAGDSSFAGTVDNVTARLVPGNHAYVTASGSRPVLARTPDRGRRNLLTYSEQFDNAAWTRTNTPTVTANTQLAVDGTLTADTLEDTSNSTYAQLSQSFTFLAAAYVFSIDIRKTSGALSSYPAIEAGPAGVYHIINTTAGTSAAVGAGQTCSVTSISTDWWRVSVSFTATAGASKVAIYPAASTDGTSLSATATGSVTVSRAQLETGSATAYQRVGLTSDVQESGKRDCWGLLFDGSDDFLQTASIDFSATDKMTVMAGVRKLSDAASGVVAELTGSVSANNGSFGLFEPSGAASKLAFASRGTSTEFAETSVTAAWAAPSTSVLTGQANISAPSVSVRRNSVSVALSTNTQGTGNYSNAIVYIGSRGGSSLRFNGLIYTLIVRGATTPTGTIADFERNLLARRCGATF